ncbi:hypothetical protein EV44_g0585 [Erysiphe necator]|uniref:Uncharacterized protein n=1 Tax=Uncinula necator TaxID=52586 RepID=A0A0B1NZZ7_UNCNE|nr:hypothetical protein EV44_g0585 [Erysiphe necator]
MQLTVYPFVSAFILSSVTASLSVKQEPGFDCGRVFFGKDVIKNAGSLVSRNLKRSTQISFIEQDPFRGRDSNSVGWPIRESGQIFGTSRTRESFYIVVDLSGRVKDVMARLSNDEYTRCSRRNRRRKSLQQDMNNGYRCGQTFFGDDQLRSDADEAISKLGQGLAFPRPYEGNLNMGRELLAWPILSTKKDNTTRWEESPFQVILSRKGNIVDVVAKLKCDDFIRCERAREPTRILRRASESSLLQRRALSHKSYSDYMCGNERFEHEYLVFSRTSATVHFETKKALQPYPKLFSESPCTNIPCKIWPIFPHKANYNLVKVGIHFLMMDRLFNIMGVIQKTQQGSMIACRAVPMSRKPEVKQGELDIVRENKKKEIAKSRLQPTRNSRGEFIVLPGTRPPVLPNKSQ